MAGRKMNTKEKVNVIKPRLYFDYYLLFATIMVSIFGTFMIFSSGFYEEGGALSNFAKQGIITIAVICVSLLLVQCTFKFWLKLAPIFLVISALMVFLVLVPHLGVEGGGASRWIKVGPITIQPSEIIKFTLILYIARIITKYRNRMRSKEVLAKIFIPTAVLFVEILVVTSNLSSAIIIILIAVGMFFMAHPNWKHFILVFGACIGLALLLVVIIEVFAATDIDLSTISNYRIRRIIAWRHPEFYTDDAAMQTLNSLYAIGAGGLIGKGLGGSIQKAIIPEVQNDMIFAVICEEIGFIGALALIALYAYIIYRMVFVAMHTKNTYASLVTVGILCQFAMHVLLNISVATNIFPNTGVTLPFVSYGSSANAILIIEIALVLKASRYIPVEQEDGNSA